MTANTLKFCISIAIYVISFSTRAQEVEKQVDLDESIETPVAVLNGTLSKKKEKYGLRIGFDILKSTISFIDEDFTGIEIVSDLRFQKNLYIAIEFGATERTDQEDFLNYTSKGGYAKVGANYNLYKNWLDMNNEIYVGVRYGFSSFSQKLNEFTPNYYGTYFDVPTYTSNIEVDGLTAHWFEFVIGLKVELFKNFFLGTSISMKNMISQDQPANFLNLYIPGFERVYVNNKGFSANYTMSYVIPVFSK